VPSSPAPLHEWQHTGDGVVFSDAKQQLRDRAAGAGADSLYRTVVFVLIGAVVVVLGVTAVMDFDWSSPAPARSLPASS
jgi:signal transduction histidine kinase